MKININERLIVALDVSSQGEALKIVSSLSGIVSFFKIGMQLFIAAGPNLAREIKDKGCKVFLDLKLHDIPNTVARGVENAGKLGVEFLSIHSLGGKKMIEAAVGAKKNCATLKLLGITVLTSLSETELQNELGVSRPLNTQVEELALLATKSGCDGVVASPLEIKKLRAKLGSSLTLVIPGIRYEAKDDQTRIATPKKAVLAGADYLVVGRPIISAPDPKEAAVTIIEDMKSAYRELHYAASKGVTVSNWVTECYPSSRP